MRMAQNRRTPGADVSEQFIAIYVPNTAAARAIHKERLTSHASKGANGRVHTARNEPKSVSEQGL